MRSTEQIRVLHLFGGKAFQGGTASVIRDIVEGPSEGVSHLIWVHREYSEESLPLLRKGSAKSVNESISSDLIGALRDLPALLGSVRKLRISILHAHSRLGIFTGWLTHQVLRTPIVFHLHFLARHRWLYRLLIKTSGGTVIYNSRKTCQHYGSGLAADHIIMPTMEWPNVDLPESSVPRLVAASALVPNKHVGVIIEAGDSLAQAGHPINLLVFGLVPEQVAPVSQREILQRYRDKQFVTFANWTRDWAENLRSRDIFVHIGQPESFGLVMLEAFARGAKMVVLRGTFFEELPNEIATKGIYYAVDLAAQDMATAILEAVNDPIDSRSLRQLRISVAPQFAKAAASEKVNSIYRSLI
jgi:glycosyltransferase involved in cell wall biosynthesis